MEDDIIDFSNYKNLQKSNKSSDQRKKEIKRPKYKCPGSHDNCPKCSSPYSHKDSRKAEKTKVISQRRQPVVEDLKLDPKEVIDEFITWRLFRWDG